MYHFRYLLLINIRINIELRNTLVSNYVPIIAMYTIYCNIILLYII